MLIIQEKEIRESLPIVSFDDKTVKIGYYRGIVMAAKKTFQFIRAADPAKAADALYKRLLSELEKGQLVLWIVSGGSNIPQAVRIMDKLPEKHLDRLAVALSDERFGIYGHADSNMHQLLQAGFNSRRATLIPVLQPAAGSQSIDTVAQQYATLLDLVLEHAQVIVAQLGMGADGHIAGILPSSPAVKAKSLVMAYDASPFRRITLTPLALQYIDVAYVYAFGKEKQKALQNLKEKRLGPSRQPSQILKQLPEVYVYNDQVGDKKA